METYRSTSNRAVPPVRQTNTYWIQGTVEVPGVTGEPQEYQFGVEKQEARKGQVCFPVVCEGSWVNRGKYCNAVLPIGVGYGNGSEGNRTVRTLQASPEDKGNGGAGP